MSTIFILPDGTPADSIVVTAGTSGTLSGSGDTSDYWVDSDAIRSFDPLEIFGDRVLCAGGEEALEVHCRRVELPEFVESYDLEDLALENAWPPDIVAACAKVLALADVARRIDELVLMAPRDFKECPTVMVALEVIAKGRALAEADQIAARIREWRKANEVPVRLPDNEE